VSSDLYRASTAMVIGYRASRRFRLVARPPAARSSAIYQITQLKGKNSPLSHAKRQRWPRHSAPQAVSKPTNSQTGAATSPSVQMSAALTPQHYRARAGDAARNIRVNPARPPSGPPAPFYRRWHRATCPHVQTMTTGMQKWFAATTAELTD